MVKVLKANGDIESFNEEKVRSSIRRAGLPASMENEIVLHIKAKLYERIPTLEIYRHIIEFLDRSKTPYAKSKYSLKQAIMALGPTGFPFEDVVAELLSIQGYKTSLRTIVSGNCINHEIDIIAVRKSQEILEKIMVEAKFHNMPGIKTNVHVALYTKARFDDVKSSGFTKCWLVTNTKMTSDAISYAQCYGIKIMSWSYPEGSSLRDFLEKSHLLPITALTTLSAYEKQTLLSNGILWCKDIAENAAGISLLSLPKEKTNSVMAEASYLSQ